MIKLYNYRKRRPLFELLIEVEYRLSPLNNQDSDLPTSAEVSRASAKAYEALKQLKISILRQGVTDISFTPRSAYLGQMLDLLDSVGAAD
jgi:hypothetical protein